MPSHYLIEGVTVLEIKSVSNDNESLCTCPSCSKEKLYVNKESGAYHCKRCGLSGRTGERKSDSPAPRRTTQKEYVHPDIVHTYIDILVNTLEVDAQVRSYFLDKKIPIELVEKYKIGHSKKIPEYPNLSIAQSLGLITDKKTNRHHNRIVFPIEKDGKYIYLTSRGIGLKSKVKFIDMSGAKQKGLFNSNCIEKYDKIYMCEGVPDTIAMIFNGYKNTVGVLGASVFPDEYVDAVREKSVILAYDGDFGGKVNAKRIGNILLSNKISTKALSIPSGHDMASYFASGYTELKEIDINEIDDSEKELMYVRSETNLSVYRYSKMEIHISDIIDRKGSLRATIQIFWENTTTNVSTINLNSSRSRNSFAKEISASISQISVQDLKKMLIDLLGSVKDKLKDDKEEEPKTSEYVMSELEREEAIKFLQSDKLMHKIKCAIDRQGVIGEDKNKLILYLIYTSRLMRKPISCIIKGPSSSGKTYIMNKVLSLVPNEGYISIQDATAKSLYYLGEDELSHKMIVIGEMHGTESANYVMREAQDGIGEGKLEILTVEKDPETNQMVTTKRMVKGPCGFVTSTTDVSINDENETRNFSIYVRVDEEKIISTGQVDIDYYEGKENPLKPQEIIIFHNAQRCLKKSLRVRIPYVRFILDKFPKKMARVMRDRKRFLVLIETIAILHQYQRNRHKKDESENEWIEATLADYNIAKMLLSEILVETVYELPPKSREIYDKVIEMQEEFIKDKMANDEFATDEETIRKEFYTTYKRIADRVPILKSKDIRRWSSPLFESGHFDYHGGEDKGKGGRGKETRLMPVDKEFYGDFLPSPEEVAKSMGWSDDKVYSPLTGNEDSISLEQEIKISVEDIDI